MSEHTFLPKRLHRFRFALLLPLALVFSGCNWVMFGFDATHSGYNSSETVIGASNVGTLVERGATVDNGPVLSSPSIWGNTLYATSHSTAGGILSAYSASGSANCTTYTPPTPQSCAPLWTTDPLGSHEYNSTPAVDTAMGIVYVGATDGVLYAYDANGTTNCSGTPKVCAPLWQSNPLGGSIDSSPTLANGYIYVSTVYGALYVMDETNGYEGNNPSCATTHAGRVCHWEWTDKTPGDVYASPAVTSSTVYTASDAPSGSTLWAFDATVDNSPNCTGTPYVDKTCSAQWKASGGGAGSSPTVVNGDVYIGSGNAGIISAFAADGSTNCSGTLYSGRTCTPLWTGTTGREAGSSPAVANGVVYIGSRAGTLYAFNATTGTPLWTAATGGSITSSPVIANGVVYVGCSTLAGTCTNSLFAFDATSGAQLWTAATGGSIDTSPIVVDDEPQDAVGAVYVSSGNQVFGYTLPS